MSTRRLSADEARRWEAWKRAHDVVQASVGRAIESASGLSVPDFAVLTRLVEIGGGELRQNELAASLGWDRSRLSRQLGRMAARGLLVSREVTDGVGRQISVTDEGRSRVQQARPAHADAVRSALLAPTSSAPGFWDGLEAIG
jgi:DNA-binding MarR family transcriptional regulator